ncbi:protein of unknown function [Pseudobutyrivibrio sp. YE44]|uniref:DUF4190 domain-containing protein n=1 Tax=Pseudobutyrivibrio sp. YE44 TaxID=1520802 RepID=UPI000891DCE1|nr:DUF4190 domain-containing protein [Pseudobutyrivibrio sp. YE44]SDB23086.1 protein of unknown function [Pseudobutyrivibrio sp. YE44]
MYEEYGNSGYYYQGPVYQQTDDSNQPINYGLAVTALVLGLLSLVFFLFGLNIITSIVSIVLGIIFLTSNAGRPNKKGRGLAIVGIVTSILSIVLFAISWVLIISNVNNVVNMFDEYMDDPNLYYQYEYNYGEDYEDLDELYNEYENLLETEPSLQEDETL